MRAANKDIQYMCLLHKQYR